MAPLNTHWHILGAGAIGCLWAAALQQTGCHVSLVSRDARHSQTLQKQLPLSVQNTDGHSRSCVIPVLEPQQLHTIDNLLICTKAHQTRQAIDSVAHAIKPDSTLVLLQNGMGNQQMLAQKFPNNPVYAAITTEAVTRLADLAIAHKAKGLTRIGPVSQKTDARLTDKLHCTLATQYCDEIESLLWQKLVINCCINPLTALYDCLNGELANLPQAQQQIPQIIAECRSVAQTQGQHTALVRIEQQVQAVIKQTAGNSSSMRQDVHHKKHTEIDFINGYIVLMAQQHAIDVPVNQSLLQQIKSLEHETHKP